MKAVYYIDRVPQDKLTVISASSQWSASPAKSPASM